MTSEAESRPGTAGVWGDVVRAVYDEVHERLWRAVLAWSGSADVADEAVAEAFAQLLRRGDVVRDPAAWAWRTAFRLAAGDLQRRRQGGGDPTLELERLAADPDRLPDDALDLIRALAQLSDQQRRCVVLVDGAGHTAPSAAAVLGTSAATVRVQVGRARRRLRTLLVDEVTPRPRSANSCVRSMPSSRPTSGTTSSPARLRTMATTT